MTLQLCQLTKVYQRSERPAVRGVTLSLQEGETFALVGESGSGKSTIARLLTLLIHPTSGEILYKGSSLHGQTRKERFAYRREVQMVFQDPYSSLNPRMTIREILTEPLEIHRLGSRKEGIERAAHLLEQVGLCPSHLNRYPHEFSGGQRQRIGIARALMVQPKILILDEPISSLDSSSAEKILDLLMDLKESLHLTYFLICHDLSIVEQRANRTGVLHQGKLVEVQETKTLFTSPSHPHTQELLHSSLWLSGQSAKEEQALLLS